jgi:hypothetical protein
MKSWKTTIGGILLGIGTPLAAAGEGIYKTIGVALATVGGLIIGLAAKDSNVTGGTKQQ